MAGRLASGLGSTDGDGDGLSGGYGDTGRAIGSSLDGGEEGSSGECEEFEGVHFSNEDRRSVVIETRERRVGDGRKRREWKIDKQDCQVFMLFLCSALGGDR